MTALPAPPHHPHDTVARPRPVPPQAPAIRDWAGLFDRMRPQVHRLALIALRLSLGVVYVWFGALKIAGVSPASDLVTGVVPWTTPSWFVAALGWFEVGLGLWLAVGWAMRWALPVFAAHMVGTFGVLVFMPHAAFQHGNPLELTMDGEFVVKNLILLSAGILVTTRTVRAAEARRSRS